MPAAVRARSITGSWAWVRTSTADDDQRRPGAVLANEPGDAGGFVGVGGEGVHLRAPGRRPAPAGAGCAAGAQERAAVATTCGVER